MAFLERHRAQLADNPRLSLPYRNLDRRSESDIREDRRTFESVSATLAKGEKL